VFVTVEAKEYLGTADECKKAWLADIQEAIKDGPDG
jgi:hypothetical protein